MPDDPDQITLTWRVTWPDEPRACALMLTFTRARDRPQGLGAAGSRDV